MATISFSTSRGAATIQEWRLIESGVWSSKYIHTVFMRDLNHHTVSVIQVMWFHVRPPFLPSLPSLPSPYTSHLHTADMILSPSQIKYLFQLSTQSVQHWLWSVWDLMVLNSPTRSVHQNLMNSHLKHVSITWSMHDVITNEWIQSRMNSQHPPPIFPPDQMLIPGDAAATPLCMLGEQMLLL